MPVWGVVSRRAFGSALGDYFLMELFNFKNCLHRAGWLRELEIDPVSYDEAVGVIPFGCVKVCY